MGGREKGVGVGVGAGGGWRWEEEREEREGGDAAADERCVLFYQ
jgi:hypothetical protein